MSQGDFIEVYEGALNAEACAQILAAFEESGAAVPGRVGGGVMPELKDSRDIQISGKPEWREAENALNTAVFGGLLAYLRKYCHALIAPAAFTHTHRGNRPLGGDKYIATSWILFQRAEQIFGSGEGRR